MQVGFGNPLNRAFDRMRDVLFDGFDPLKYLKIGLAAFLVSLTDACNPASGQLNLGGWSALLEPAGWLPLSGFFGGWSLFGPVALVSLILMVLKLWLSANGCLIFVDQVVRDRGDFTGPWGRLSRRANNLFLWMLAFMVVVVGIAATPLWPALRMVRSWNPDSGVSWSEALVGFTQFTVAGFFAGLVALAAAGIWILIQHFMVPLMVRDDTGLRGAWRKFRPVLWRHAPDFLLYGLLIAAMYIGVGLVLVVLTLATCCIAGFVLAIPYVGTLLLLPFWTFIRLFSLEFLAQFGPDFTLSAVAAGELPGDHPDPGGADP